MAKTPSLNEFLWFHLTVSSKTYCVIVGENPGSKYDKAKELGITIWNEEELISNARR